MKHIQAYIKPHKLSTVVNSLRDIPEMTGMSISDIKGFGRGRAENASCRIIDGLISFVPMVKIEIMCLDAAVDRIVDEIRRSAFTGLKGDGKIYVSEIETALRISTGETGNDAV